MKNYCVNSNNKYFTVLVYTFIAMLGCGLVINVWPSSLFPNDSNIDRHISNLRSELRQLKTDMSEYGQLRYNLMNGLSRNSNESYVLDYIARNQKSMSLSPVYWPIDYLPVSPVAKGLLRRALAINIASKSFIDSIDRSNVTENEIRNVLKQHIEEPSLINDMVVVSISDRIQIGLNLDNSSPALTLAKAEIAELVRHQDNPVEMGYLRNKDMSAYSGENILWIASS